MTRTAAKPMPRRPLGKTGLLVTPIGLGLAALGRPAYITGGRAQDLGGDRGIDTLERRSHAVLTAAWDAGIRYFDVARSYGYAERFLASWLQTRNPSPSQITVGSKWGYTYVGDWRIDAPVHELKDHSLAALDRQVGESRALLDGFLSLYQIHSATLESGVLEDRLVLQRLLELRERGLRIGLSVSGPRQAEVIRRAMAVAIDGVNPFQSVQATWNPLEPTAATALAEASAAGWGVIVKEALANGRLASLDQFAIAAALAQPWADVVLSGAVTEDQLRSNVEGLSRRLSAGERAELDAMAEPPSRYWKERSERPWQ